TREGYVHVNDTELHQGSFERNVPLRPTTNSVLGVNAGVHSAAPPSTWNRNRPERTSVAGAETPRPDRMSHRDPVANTGGTAALDNNRPSRAVPRPTDRGNPTAEAERPRGIPNAANGSPAPVNN